MNAALLWPYTNKNVLRCLEDYDSLLQHYLNSLLLKILQLPNFLSEVWSQHYRSYRWQSLNLLQLPGYRHWRKADWIKNWK